MRISLVAVALVVLLVGCGGGSPTAQDDPSPAAVETVVAAPPTSSAEDESPAPAAEPSPSPDVTYGDLLAYAERASADQLASLLAEEADCIAGDDTACNRLWQRSLLSDPEGTFIVVAATCGGRVPEHRPENLDDVAWAPCPVG